MQKYIYALEIKMPNSHDFHVFLLYPPPNFSQMPDIPVHVAAIMLNKPLKEMTSSSSLSYLHWTSLHANFKELHITASGLPRWSFYRPALHNITMIFFNTRIICEIFYLGQKQQRRNLWQERPTLIITGTIKFSTDSEILWIGIDQS